MIRSLIIFDYDGTLVDSLKLHAEIWKQVLGEVGVKTSEKELWKRFGMTAEDILREILPQNLHDKMESVSRRESNLFIAKLSELKLMPKVKKVLNELKSKSIPMAIATSMQKKSLEKSLTFLNIRNLFDYIATSEDVRKGKPSPDIFLEIARKAAVRPEFCLVVGDTIYDAEAAIRSGMKVVIVGDPASRNRIEEMNVPIVEDFERILNYVFA